MIGDHTVITAGSVLLTGFVSPELPTTPVLVNAPVLLVVVAFTVIPERVTPDAIVALVVQANEFAGRFAIHVHGAIFGTERSVTPAGRVSVTVVNPVAVSGHSFLTWSRYVNPVLVGIFTAVAIDCASLPLTNFLIERSNPGGTGGHTVITAGSVLLTGLVSPGLATTPMLVNAPVLLVVIAFTVISGRSAPEAIVADVVQINELVGRLGIHDHGATFGTERSVTPAGRVSVTVVNPVAVSGHSFLTWSTYVNPVLVGIFTAVARVCASLPLTNFLIERSKLFEADGIICITAGSVLLAVITSLGLDNSAVLVRNVLLDDTLTATAIVGNDAPIASASVRVQVNEVDPLAPVHNHHAPTGVAVNVTHAGRGSMIVVVELTRFPEPAFRVSIV
jgi:hypothetical protein